MTKKIKYYIWIFLGILIAIIGIISFEFAHAHFKKPTPTPKILVTTAQAHKILLSHNVSATGNVVAIQNTQLSPKVGGYVTQIHYHEGDHVIKGQALVQLDNRHERNAVATAAASYKLDTLQVTRDKRLLKRGLIQQDAYHVAQVAEDQDQAALEVAQDNLADKVIRAPFSGTVGSRNISVGDYVSTGNPITTLVDRQHLKAIYTLPAHYQYQLKLGQAVLISSNTTAQHFIAHASYIAPIVDPLSQTIEVHAKLNNTGGVLRPGQFVKINQVIAKNQPTLVIPVASAIPNLSGYYVYTIKNHRATKTAITIGQLDDKMIAVTAGLHEGDTVIVGGIDKIHPGSLVKTVKAL